MFSRRCLNIRTFSTFVRECSYIKATAGEHKLENMFSRRCLSIQIFSTFVRECSYIKATVGEHKLEKYVLPSDPDAESLVIAKNLPVRC